MGKIISKNSQANLICNKNSINLLLNRKDYSEAQEELKEKMLKSRSLNAFFTTFSGFYLKVKNLKFKAKNTKTFFKNY
jgi:hypothetical protein